MNNEKNTAESAPGKTPQSTPEAFKGLYDIIARLRGPGGCPWDIEQTPLTLRETLIEEAYETVEALNDGDVDHVCEEIGDVFLNATMLAYMYEQDGVFSVADALRKVSEKLVRRHPHVFGETAGFAGPDSGEKTDTAAKVLDQWENIKANVEGRKSTSVLDAVPGNFPPLLRAYKLQKKAAKVGFDWDCMEDVWGKVHEELDELKEAIAGGDTSKMEGELGDLIFALVNIGRHLKIDPSVALTRTNTKFIRRFRHVEAEMLKAGIPMVQANLVEMDQFWDEAKAAERADEGRTR